MIILILAVLLVISGCAPHSSGPREQTGTLLGAGAGALLGAQVGSGRGRLVAVAMKQNAHYALEYSPSHNSTQWRNPDSGNRGEITPIDT